MADSKISALTEKTTFGETDFLAGTQGTDAGDNRKYGKAAIQDAVADGFIPLAGTEVGSPVTGGVQMGENGEIIFGNIKLINSPIGINALGFYNTEEDTQVGYIEGLTFYWLDGSFRVPNVILVNSGFTLSQTFSENLTDSRNVLFRDKTITVAGLEDLNITTGYTVATLPASPVTGQRAHVTDATATSFYSIVAGGGANVVPVFYNGTNWVIA